MTTVAKPAPGRRPNGEGGFIDLGNGRWAFRRMIAGKLIQRSATADTEAKAKRLAKGKVEDAIKLLESGVNPASGRVKLGDYAQAWLDDEMRPRYDADGKRYRGVSQASIENYARDVRRIHKYLGEVRLDQLRVPHVRGMLVRMANAGETPENQRTTLVRLGTILNWAEANGDVAKNVAAAHLVKRPEPAKRRPVKPQEDDLRRVLRAVDGDPLEVLVWLGLGAGLRRGELLGLQWEDIEYVDAELAWLVVRRRVSYLGQGVGRQEQEGLKNDDAEKRIPVGGLVLDALRRRWVYQVAQRRDASEPGHRQWRGPEYQPDTRTGFIFTNPTDGKPMNPRSADKAFATIRDRAGLDIERFHALRHAFTTLLRSSGTRDRVAQTLTGHRDPAMLDYYDDPMESEKVAAAQRLDVRLRELLGTPDERP